MANKLDSLYGKMRERTMAKWDCTEAEYQLVGGKLLDMLADPETPQAAVIGGLHCVVPGSVAIAAGFCRLTTLYKQWQYFNITPPVIFRVGSSYAYARIKMLVENAIGVKAVC